MIRKCFACLPVEFPTNIRCVNEHFFILKNVLGKVIHDFNFLLCEAG